MDDWLMAIRSTRALFAFRHSQPTASTTQAFALHAKQVVDDGPSHILSRSSVSRDTLILPNCQFTMHSYTSYIDVSQYDG